MESQARPLVAQFARHALCHLFNRPDRLRRAVTRCGRTHDLGGQIEIETRNEVRPADLLYVHQCIERHPGCRPSLPSDPEVAYRAEIVVRAL